MGDRSELNITISFTKEGTTYARLTKITGRSGNTKVTQLSTGMAQCHPDDKFDPQIGAMIAMARMFGDEVEFKPEKEEPERKLTDAEKKALKRGYTLVRDRLPSCTAYDGRYSVMDTHGGEGGGLYWDHKGKTFTCVIPDSRMTGYDRNYARKIWMESPDSVIAWKVLPDTVEQKALDEGYTLCRDRYPDKSGQYDIMTEYGGHWGGSYWSSRWKTFGTSDDSKKSIAIGIQAWMTKGENPAIAWKEHK